MRIRELRAVPVRVPRLPRFLPKTAHGEVSASEYVVLELLTEDGVIGIGEVTCAPRWNGEEWAGTTMLVRDGLDALLRGADTRSWPEIEGRLDAAFTGRPFLRAGIEMACLDVEGRALGRPVVDLLGGAHRERIETKLVLPAREVETVRAMAADLAGLGVGCAKVKVGLGVEEDIARIAAVREVLGLDVPITVDANEGWQPEQGRRGLAELASHRVVAVEQPLPRSAWQASADLRSHTTAAIVGDESIWTLHDVVHAAEVRAFDVVSVYPGKCGGLRTALELAATADALGLGVSFGSNLELGVGSAALAHAAAASPRLSQAVPSDVIGPLYFESSLVTDDSFVTWSGATLPAHPGLGVELDRDALSRYRIDRDHVDDPSSS